MILSIDEKTLGNYILSQINFMFPDNINISDVVMDNLPIALERLDFCFKHVAYLRYNNKGETIYNHLYADHNVVLYWFLSNTIFKNTQNINAASKLYYLNKALHGLDCMYDTMLPDIFLIFHSSGTMLGKAKYDNFFVALHGCTVGSHKGKYPQFGKGVALAANSSAIGDCVIGNRCTIATRTTAFNKNLVSDQIIYSDFESGKLCVKASKECYAQQFF